MQGFPFEPASQIAVCDTTKCRQLIVTNHNEVPTELTI